MASSRFLGLLDQQRAIHIGKSAGYAGRNNPDTWANFRNAERLGITPLQGCLVRMSDKWERALNLIADPLNEQVGESFDVTMLDLSNYGLISVCLRREQEEGRDEAVFPRLDRPPMFETEEQANALKALIEARRDIAELPIDDEMRPLQDAIDGLLKAVGVA